jgi:hypothetical protein
LHEHVKASIDDLKFLTGYEKISGGIPLTHRKLTHYCIFRVIRRNLSVYFRLFNRQTELSGILPSIYQLTNMTSLPIIGVGLIRSSTSKLREMELFSTFMYLLNSLTGSSIGVDESYSGYTMNAMHLV